MTCGLVTSTVCFSCGGAAAAATAKVFGKSSMVGTNLFDHAFVAGAGDDFVRSTACAVLDFLIAATIQGQARLVVA